jgi:hypothetical protein
VVVVIVAALWLRRQARAEAEVRRNAKTDNAQAMSVQTLLETCRPKAGGGFETKGDDGDPDSRDRSGSLDEMSARNKQELLQAFHKAGDSSNNATLSLTNIILVFTAFLIVAMLLGIFLMWDMVTQNQLVKVVDAILVQINTQVRLDVDNVFVAPAQIHALAALAASRRYLPFEGAKSISDATSQSQITRFDAFLSDMQITYDCEGCLKPDLIYMGFENDEQGVKRGYFEGVSRDESTTPTSYAVKVIDEFSHGNLTTTANVNNGWSRQKFLMQDYEGLPGVLQRNISKALENKEYDPRLRAWFIKQSDQTAANRLTTIWTEPYTYEERQ